MAVRCLTGSLDEGSLTMDTGIHGKYFCSLPKVRSGNWYCHCFVLYVGGVFSSAGVLPSLM